MKANNIVKSTLLLLAFGCLSGEFAAEAAERNAATNDLERQFRTLPMESRRLTGPLFWLHGDETPERLQGYVAKVAEGGNGCFTAESRPHSEWLGPGWFRDLSICLDAAKEHNLQMWIFDERMWPSQSIGGTVPPRYAAKRLAASAVDVEGSCTFEAGDYAGNRYVAAVAGRVNVDGKLDGDSLIDLAPFVRDGNVSWRVPAGKWKVMKFIHVQAPPLGQDSFGRDQLSVDGASKDCVEWFLETTYQPHYEHLKADFGKTIRGFFYDEPETRGDWGTELNAVLAEWNVDWKKAYVAYKFELAGEEQTAARYQYLDAFAETWGRIMYGGMTKWCEERGVKSIGHFMEQSRFYTYRNFCAGDVMRLMKYSSMGGIDAVLDQFVMGRRVGSDPPCWQTTKLASSISHVFNKPDDVAMVEFFGGKGNRTQNFTYSDMKWCTDHMQVSGINFLIPHSFNPRAPYDNDWPPYYYNGGFDPRWPLYRVFADYTSRLSLMLTGGRHVCPVAILWGTLTGQMGKAVTPEDLTSALQDAQFDSDWLPFEVFEKNASLDGHVVKLYGERYRVLVLPPVEVIPYATLAKAKEFFDGGGVVVGYGFLPSKSATIGKGGKDIVALCHDIWGDSPKPGTTACKTNAVGGRSYLLSQSPPRNEVTAALAADANVHPTLEVIEGKTDGWLHVLHRVKDGKDVFFVCNQNWQGSPRRFKFRAIASGTPECWDAMRNEITAISFQRIDANTVEFVLPMEPSESVLLVFQPKQVSRPVRIEPGMKPIRDPIVLVRDPNPPTTPLVPQPQAGRLLNLSPVKTADPFRSRLTVPADLDLTQCRLFLEMDDLPDNAAVVTVNGKHAGGTIGRPTSLDITRQVKPGENTILIEPLAPDSARCVLYK